MKLKLTRDEARTIQQNIFPYLLQVCDMKVQTTPFNQDENLLAKVFRSITRDIKLKLDKKLVGTSNSCSIALNDSETIIFLRSLQATPIEPHNVWMLQLVSKIINELYQEICKPEILY